MSELLALIEAALERARDPNEVAPAGGGVYVTREQAIVITKLEEAFLWQRRVIEKKS